MIDIAVLPTSNIANSRTTQGPTALLTSRILFLVEKAIK